MMVKIPAAIIAASLLYVAYQTLAPQAPWMTEFDGAATAHVSGIETIIDYTRTFRATEPATAVIYRTVSCGPAHPSFDLPEVSRRYDAQRYSNHRLITVPYKYPVGALCELQGTVVWRPVGSLRDHEFAAPSIAFEVEDARDKRERERQEGR